MPIKKELYPANWPEISAAIRARAGNKCESCGIPNCAETVRIRGKSLRRVRIVLTVAHLNQNPADNRPENLKCLCQRCHLNWDRPFNLIKRHATWARKRREAIAETGQLEIEGLL